MLRPLRSVRRRSASYACCYRLLLPASDRMGQFSHENGLFTLGIVAERLGFEPRELALCGFQVWVRRSWTVVDAGFARDSAGPPGLESADVRPRCYRLLLPVDTPERELGDGRGRELIG